MSDPLHHLGDRQLIEAFQKKRRALLGIWMLAIALLIWPFVLIFTGKEFWWFFFLAAAVLLIVANVYWTCPKCSSQLPDGGMWSNWRDGYFYAFCKTCPQCGFPLQLQCEHSLPTTLVNLKHLKRPHLDTPALEAFQRKRRLLKYMLFTGVLFMGLPVLVFLSYLAGVSHLFLKPSRSSSALPIMIGIGVLLYLIGTILYWVIRCTWNCPNCSMSMCRGAVRVGLFLALASVFAETTCPHCGERFRLDTPSERELLIGSLAEKMDVALLIFVLLYLIWMVAAILQRGP